MCLRWLCVIMPLFLTNYSRALSKWATLHGCVAISRPPIPLHRLKGTREQIRFWFVFSLSFAWSRDGKSGRDHDGSIKQRTRVLQEGQCLCCCCFLFDWSSGSSRLFSDVGVAFVSSSTMRARWHGQCSKGHLRLCRSSHHLVCTSTLAGSSLLHKSGRLRWLCVAHLATSPTRQPSSARLRFTNRDTYALPNIISTCAFSRRSDQPLCVIHPAPVTYILVLCTTSPSTEGCRCNTSLGSSGATRLLRCYILSATDHDYDLFVDYVSLHSALIVFIKMFKFFVVSFELRHHATQIIRPWSSRNTSSCCPASPRCMCYCLILI